MRFIHIIVPFIIGNVIYDLFGVYESTNWSIYMSSLMNYFIIGSLYVNAKRNDKFKKLYYLIMGVYFIQQIWLMTYINRPFEIFENETGYTCYYDYGALIIIALFLFDYGRINGKNILKRIN